MTPSPVPLNRKALAERGEPDAGAPPARIIHFGLGHFFRAHQAWYTARAADASEWGIVAFTGRTAEPARVLAAQDGLFSLVERGAEEDIVEVVTSVVDAVPSDDIARLSELAADPAVAVVTLTVTEHGYALLPDGSPNLDDADVRSDLESLRSGGVGVRTVLGRLVTLLEARRAADAGAIAIVSCDNVPHNGDILRRGIRAYSQSIDDTLAEWIDQNASFVNTSVDRITPHVSEAPESVAAAGWIDRSAVVTEPFSDWVLAGNFPAGRPAWESAGARFVDDIEPWENRKLWLLNGAHTLLTVSGLPRGHSTVAEAIADEGCRTLVDSFWAEAVECLPEGTEHVRYRAQLRERFANPRIVHRLTQIAAETSIKVQFRIAAVAERTFAAGRSWDASARAFAAWIDWVSSRPTVPDSRAAEIGAACAISDPTRGLIGLVSPTLASQSTFVDAVRRARC